LVEEDAVGMHQVLNQVCGKRDLFHIKEHWSSMVDELHNVFEIPGNIKTKKQAA
jgi:hypothetical protein